MPFFFSCGRTRLSQQQLCAAWCTNKIRVPKKYIFRRNKLFSKSSAFVAFNCFCYVSCFEDSWCFNIRGKIPTEEVWLPHHDPFEHRDESHRRISSSATLCKTSHFITYFPSAVYHMFYTFLHIYFTQYIIFSLSAFTYLFGRLPVLPGSRRKNSRTVRTAFTALSLESQAVGDILQLSGRSNYSRNWLGSKMAPCGIARKR